ncbi:MAG: sigma-70 family RNA polymerase sigma factor, partial [Myxococcota bacterium]
MTDEQLCVASGEGKRDAFVELVRRYQALVCAVTFAATTRRDVSEDLAQETFLAAWRGVGKVKDPARVGGWLASIARNLSRKSHRSRTTERLPEPAMVSTDPDPEHAMADQQASARLWDVLGTLPERSREAMILYYREERSAPRVAEMLGISVAAAEQRLSRGRRLLRDKLERELSREVTRTRPDAGFTRRVAAALPALPMLTPPAASGAGASAATTKWAVLLLAAVAIVVAIYGLAPTKSSPAAAPSDAALAEAAAPHEPRSAPPREADDAPLVSGIVVDASTGSPVAGAVVTIAKPDGEPARVERPGQPRSLAVTVAAADGTWALPGLPSG